MIKCVIHCSDIHIRRSERHEEYQEQFEKFYQEAKEIASKYNPDEVRIVVAGDIVHNKVSVTNELYVFVNKFISSLGSIAKTIVIAGNHDLLVGNNDKMDTITPLFEIGDYSNVIYLDRHLGYKSGVYVDDNVAWCLYSILDNYNVPNVESIDKNLTKVGLFHGPIINSVSSSGYVMVNGISIDIFNVCDIVMAGDIHKQQSLYCGDTKVVYPSSLIQQNFGESVENHGYMVWDMNTLDAKFHEIDNDSSQFKIRIESTESLDNDTYECLNFESSTLGKMTQKSKIRAEWKVFPWDYNSSEINSLRASISSKFGVDISRVSIEPKFKSIENVADKEEYKNTTLQDIQNPIFQKELEKKYIEVNNIENIDMNIIDKLDDELNTLMDYDVYDKQRKYSIEWIEWGNFCSYGPNNRLDLTDLKGLVLINGEPSNQAGKTTFAIDVQKFLLYGDGGDKGSTLSDLFNRFLENETQFYVRGCIKIADKKYVIERVVTRPKKRKETYKSSQTVHYYELNGEELNELKDVDITDKTEEVVATNRIIKETIGKESDYDLIISATSKTLDEIIDIGDAERGRILSRWIGLMPIEHKEEIAKSKYKEFVQTSLVGKYNKEDLLENIKTLDTETSDSEAKIKDIEAKIQQSNAVIDNFNISRDSLLSQKKQIDNSVLSIDIVTENNKLNRTLEEGKALRAKEKSLTEQISQLSPQDMSMEEFQSSMSKKSEMEKQQAEINAHISMNNRKINELNGGKICPTCKRPYDATTIANIEAQVKSLSEENSSYAETLKSLSSQCVELKSFIDSYVANQKIVESKGRSEIELGAIKVKIANTLTLYSEIKNKIEEYNKNKEAIEFNNQLTIKIGMVDASINAEKSNNQSLNNNLVMLKSKIESNNMRKKEIESTITRLDNDIMLDAHWKLLLTMMGKNGISKMVLRNTLPIINGELSRTLADVADFDVRIEINDKNDVCLQIINEGVVGKLSSTSGYERTLAGLAIRDVLANISSMPRPNFLVLDEVLSMTASENYEKLKLMIDKIVNRYQFVFFISHADETKEWANKIITVRKKGRISTIETNF